MERRVNNDRDYRDSNAAAIKKNPLSCKMELNPPVMYLVDSDFTPSGDLDPKLARKPIFVMFQAGYCGHCTTAKPAFQALADEGIVQCATFQADGDRPDEKALAKRLDTVYPGFRGFPSYMLFVNGKKIPHVGGRSVNDMKQFVMQYV
jgi:thiol-disulfide isomerase/thioredoxin